MSTRPLQFTKEQAEDLLKTNPELSEMVYSAFPELRPEYLVIDSWEALERIEGHYINNHSTIKYAEYSNASTNDNNKNIFKSKKQALSALAYAQLTQLMAATGDCDNIDWEDVNSTKYCIVRFNGGIIKYVTDVYHYFLAFNTESVRDEFLEKHQELIRQFYQLD